MKPLRYLVPWLALIAAVLGVCLLQPGQVPALAPAVPSEPSAPASPFPASPAPHVPAISASPAPVEEADTLSGVWVPYLSLATEEHTQAAFEANFKAIADKARDRGLSALFVHVRAFCDALYPSERYPWSHLLTGTQGQDPGFDPLDFMVEYTHSLGMEFHAWINPLRVRTAETPRELSADNPYQALGQSEGYYFMEWEGAVYLNPAYPYVRTLVAQGAAEIAERYPVDGVHFDDYFYPTQDPALDGEAYELYCGTVEEPLSLLDWRTANISALVAEVYDRVKAARPEASFGIAPQGNLENDRNMGADVAAWCAMPGYLDYICPQLYYGFEDPSLPYGEALAQWQGLTRREGLKLYVGLALYKQGDQAQGADWMDEGVIDRQIEAARAVACDGVVLYSADYLE